jgi:hypothetical protein
VCQCLTPVTVTTWESEFGRITIPGLPRQKHLQDPVSTVTKKLEMVMQTCLPSYDRKLKIRGSLTRPAWAKSETLSSK